MSNEVKCPKCGSTQLTANKKGYSIKKGLIGMAFTGGVGLLGGLFGSGDITITCLVCGNSFKPGGGDYLTIPDVQSTSNCDPKITHVKSDPPRVVMQKLKCENCGSLNDLGIRYCRVCGVKVCYDNIKTEKNGQLFDYVNCSECNNKTPKPSKKCRYCTNCGKELL